MLMAKHAVLLLTLFLLFSGISFYKNYYNYSGKNYEAQTADEEIHLIDKALQNEVPFIKVNTGAGSIAPVLIIKKKKFSVSSVKLLFSPRAKKISPYFNRNPLLYDQSARIILHVFRI